jgi:hypothetical protein
VRIGTPGRAFLERVRLELNEPPEGIAIQKVSPSSDGAEILLRSDAAKTKVGLKGNLIVAVVTTNAPQRSAAGAKPAADQRRVAGMLPAIPFEVVRQ